MLKKIFYVLISFALSFPSFSQTVLGEKIDFNQNPSSLVWKKINSDHFEVIFPEEIERQAQRATFLLEKIYPYVSRSLEIRPRKISLILQNQSVLSNGFVTLAPRRSEWYVTPSIDPLLTNTEWIKTLAVHEFRHVVQFEKSRQNINRYFEFFLGEIGAGLGLAFSIPSWVLEGDAVGMETALTSGGRGRLPVFERDLRALLLSGKKISFDEAYLRSYNYWIPNHYVYGYFLTSYLRELQGDLFLSKLIDESTEHSWNPLSFYNAVDDMMAGDFEKFYQTTMSDLLNHWKESFNQLNPSPFQVMNLKEKRGQTHFSYPMITNNGRIIALKSGLGDIEQFVEIKSDKSERTLFYPAPIMQEAQIKMRNDRFSYLEYEIDARWGYRDFQRLVVYDVSAEKEIFSLSQAKFRLSVVNESGTKILALEWTTDQKQNLVIIDIKTKNIKKIRLPNEKVITSIDWKNDSECVAVLKDRDELKQLVSINLVNESISPLIEKTYDNLGNIFSSKGKILVESPQTGIDNIFILRQGKLYPLTSSRFGAYHPVIFKNKLYYNEYEFNGMNVAQKEEKWDKEEDLKSSFYPVFEKFSFFEKKDEFEKDLSRQQIFKVEKYSQVKSALNFHSWLIVAPPLSQSLSLMTFSQDLLNKFQLTVGGSYFFNEQTSSVFSTLSWSHYFPVYDFSLEFGGRRVYPEEAEEKDKWQEGVLEIGFSLPWKKIYGAFSSQFAIRSFAKIIHAQGREISTKYELSNESLFSRGSELSWSVLKRTAPRDFMPPLGWKINFHFEEGEDISGSLTKGSLLSSRNQFFHFGFLKHHVFLHEISFEKQLEDNYRYSSLVLYPRGMSHYFFEEFVKYSGNYSLPLAYPDSNLGRYFYLKRVILNIFYDSLNPKGFTSLSSTGGEVLFESHFFRLPVPLNWGMRGSYILSGPEKNESHYELFLSSNIAVF
jgi:hypothetical protein